MLSPLIFCGCNDERITQLEGRIAKLEKAVHGLEKIPRETVTIVTPAPTPIPTAFPTRANTGSPIEDTVYKLSGDEKDDPFIGVKDGEILLMAFIDYESQASRRFANVTLPELKKEFSGKPNRRLVLRDYPLPHHGSALSAAIYAQCAGEQGKYWQAFDKITSTPLEEIGSTLKENLPGVNTSKFNACRSSKRYLTEIEKDQRDGQALGTQGSPSFFLGKCKFGTCTGKFIRGAQPLGLFKKFLHDLEFPISG